MIISPSSFSGVFVLPASIADSTLKTVSGNFLKVIIYIYRNCADTVDAERISAATGVPVGEVNDALWFWTGKGLLADGENASVHTSAQSDSDAANSDTANNGISIGNADGNSTKRPETTLGESEKKAADADAPTEKSDSDISQPKEKKEHISVKPKPLTHDVICRRIEESNEVRTLFLEAEGRLGRVIGSGDQSSLLLLHDYYGLPVEVILALCEYASSSGKCGNMNYIFTVGVDWSKREIDTLEEADEEFKRIQSIDKNWVEFCKITGVRKKKPTVKQSEFLSSWIERYHFSTEMLTCAYEEMSKHMSEMSFPYMNKILTAWYNAGVDTPEKVKLHEQEFADKAAKRASAHDEKKKAFYTSVSPSDSAPRKPASYDIEKAQQKAKAAVPVLKKKEKR